MSLIRLLFIMGGCFGSRPRKTQPLPIENTYQLKGQTKSQTFPILKQGFIQRLYISQFNSYNKRISIDQFTNFFAHTEYPKATLQILFTLFEKQNQYQISILELQNGMEALIYETDEEIIQMLFWMYSDDVFKKVISAAKIKTMQLENIDCFKENSPSIQESNITNKSAGLYPLNDFVTWMKECFNFEPFREKIISRKIVQMQRQIITYYNEMENNDKNQKYEYLISIRWWQSLKLYLLARYQARVEHNGYEKSQKLEAGRLSTILANIPSNIIFLVKSEDEKINLGIVGKFQCKAGIDNRKLRGSMQAELESNLSYGTDYVIVNPKLYSLLFTLYGGGPQFKRQIKKGDLFLYPIFLRQFLFENFQIIDETFSFVQYSKFDKFSEIQKHYRGNVFYYKQFAGGAWNRLNYSSDKHLYQIGLQSNSFLINMDEVNQKFFLRMYGNEEKQQTKLENPCYGDVYLTKSDIVKKKICVIRITTKQIIFQSMTGTGSTQYLCSVADLPNILSLCDYPITSTTAGNGLLHSGNGEYINSVVAALFFQPTLSMKFMIEPTTDTPLLKQVNQLVVSHLDSVVGNTKYLKQLVYPPKSSTVQQYNDSYKFMLDLINKFQEEQQSNEKNSKYITRALNGKIRVEHQCMACSTTTQKNQSFKILTLPVPEEKYFTYTVYLRRCGAHRKFQFKLEKNATLFNLHEAFQNISLLKSQQYELFQIQQNDVYRYLYLYEKQLTLREINLKPTDRICAYLKSAKNYQVTTQPNIYVSIQLPEEQVVGEILSTMPKSSQVSYRDSNGVLFNRVVETSKLQKFPNQERKRFLWMKVLNRDFFDLEPISDPTMIHIPDWCTMAELQTTIFKKYQKANTKEAAFILRYLDSQSKCIVCHKFIKGMMNEKEKQFIGIFCKGKCKVNPLAPILSFPGLMIAIDWACLESFNKFSESSSSEPIQQDQTMSVQHCVKSYFNLKYLQKRCDKCSKNTKHLQVKKMTNHPQLLIIHLQRFPKEEKRKKIQSYLRFNEDLQIKSGSSVGASSLGEGLYQLSSVICHSGDIRYGRFYPVVKQNSNWIFYNQEVSKISSFDKIDPKSIYMLLYELVN